MYNNQRLREKIKTMGFRSLENPEVLEEAAELIQTKTKELHDIVFSESHDKTLAKYTANSFKSSLVASLREGQDADPEIFVPQDVETEKEDISKEFTPPNSAVDKSHLTNYGSPEYKASKEAEDYVRRQESTLVLTYQANPWKTFVPGVLKERTGEILHEFDPTEELSEEEMMDLVEALGGERFALREDKIRLSVNKLYAEEFISKVRG
jgi:hypothetical protein